MGTTMTPKLPELKSTSTKRKPVRSVQLTRDEEATTTFFIYKHGTNELVRQLVNSHIPSSHATVLSFSNDPKHLHEREAAIRNAGFGVISVASEIAARFEIEMGRCGVLLICYTIPPIVSDELASLFRRSCPGGLIIVVLNQQPASEADVAIPASDGPDAIVRSLHTNLKLPKAS